MLPAGHYEFKLVRSGTWTGFDNAGNNFAFDLSASAKVNFYINEDLNQARISLPNLQGIQQYTPVLPAAQWPRLVGDLQPLFGEAEWSPGGSQQFFVDYNFDNTIYKIQRTLPVGSYQAKVILARTGTAMKITEITVRIWRSMCLIRPMLLFNRLQFRQQKSHP